MKTVYPKRTDIKKMSAEVSFELGKFCGELNKYVSNPNDNQRNFLRNQCEDIQAIIQKLNAALSSPD